MRRFILTALLLTASVALAADPATKPATFTNHDVVNARIALGRHTLLDTYNTDGVHSPQWDDKAKAFLELMAQRFGDANEDSTYCTDVDTSLSTMVPLADALGKCGDPLVNYCRAIIYKDSGDSEAYTATINRWAPKVVAGKYPALRRYYAAAALARLSPRNAELAKQRDDLFLPMLLMPLPDPIDRRLMVAYAVDNWDNMQTPAGQKSVPRGALIDQLEAQKGDPWIIAVLRGTNAITAAWESRGNGFANTVTPAGWAGFGKSIALARQNFQAAYGMEPTYPEAASGMITVCMAESGQADDPRVWFDRAIGAQIDYMNAWSGYAQVLQPRWGGSLPAMMALASEAAATKRYDTIVPFYAATVLLMMTKENQAGDTVYRRRGVWDILLNVYDGYLDPPAKNINVQWVATYRAVYAWKCGQFAEALRTLNILGEQVNADALANFDLTADLLRADCRALTGPHGDALRTADAYEFTYEFGQARSAYDRVLAKMDEKDADRPYVYRRRAGVALSDDVGASKVATVPFATMDDLLPFKGETAGWSVKDDVLTFTGTAARESTLVHRALLPPKTRVKVEWSWSCPQAGHAPAFDLVLQDTRAEGFVTVSNFPKENIVCLDMGKYTFVRKKAPVSPIDLKPETWHTLEVEHDGNSVTVKEDGQVLIASYKNDWVANGKTAVGLVAHTPDVGGQIKVRNLTIEMTQ